MERFETHLGWNYDPKYLSSLSDEELVAKIYAADEWDADLIRDLCWRADLDDEWEALDDLGGADDLIEKAANILGIRIPDEEPSHEVDEWGER